MVKGRWLDIERRKFTRLKDDIFISCSLLSPPAKFKAVTRNIGGGGLMFETERRVLPGSKMVIEIYQPMNSGKTLIFSVPILARVVWTKKIEKDKFEQGENKYRVGIQFGEIEEDDRQIIVNYVEKNALEA